MCHKNENEVAMLKTFKLISKWALDLWVQWPLRFQSVRSFNLSKFWPHIVYKACCHILADESFASDDIVMNIIGHK